MYYIAAHNERRMEVVYRRMEVAIEGWKDGRTVVWKNGRTEGWNYRPRWNGPSRLPYVTMQVILVSVPGLPRYAVLLASVRRDTENGEGLG